LPIVDVEVVVRSEESLASNLAARLAEACGEIFGSAPGGTWVKVRSVLRTRYAENGGNLPEDFYPVFVTVLKAKLPSPKAMQTEVASLTEAVAQTCGRPQENVHVIYEPEAAGRQLDAIGIAFLFAPLHHPATRAVVPVRKALGVRTIFNLLGPLANPAQVPFAVIGAWSLEVAALMADTLAGMPIVRVFVVYGDAGWDEPTPASPFTLFDVRPGSVVRSRRCAADFGLPECRESELIGADAAHNARRLHDVLRDAPRRRIPPMRSAAVARCVRAHR